MNHLRMVGVAALIYLTGCATVSVMPSGIQLTTAPKPVDCTIQFFRTTKPERAYDEIATLTIVGGPGEWAAGAEQDFLRKKACEIGADAAIVTRDGNGREPMIVVAIKYR